MTSSRSAAVRAATDADLAVLAAIHHRSQSVAYAGLFPAGSPVPSVGDVERAWRSAVAGPVAAVAMVAEVDGLAVGGVVARAQEEPGFGHLQKLYVDPDAWGRGVGRQLHDAALSWLERAGVSSASLWVLQGNERARRCYERWGWELDRSPDGVLEHTGGDVREVRYRHRGP